MRKNLLTNLMSFALIIAIAFTGLNAQTKDNKNSEVIIKTSAFSFMCKDKIENKVKELDGVEDGFLNLDNQIITIQYDMNKVTSTKLREVIKSLGYDAEILPKDTSNDKKDESKKIGSKLD